MDENTTKQIRFTLNLGNECDRKIYEILKKQPNMSEYIRNALFDSNNKDLISVSDLKEMEERIVNHIRKQDEECRKSEVEIFKNLF